MSAFSGYSSLTNITFEMTKGWYVGNSEGAKTTAISSTDLANTSTAATYLTGYYNVHYWTRDTSAT